MIRMDKKEIARWIQGLISQGKLHLFYISAVWRRTRERALKRQHYECQRCKVKGRYERATVAHHKQYLRRRPDLALDLDNLEALCDQCHYEEHHKKENKYANDEKW
jgi:5-methylcytosine-specific restriction enzyme A